MDTSIKQQLLFRVWGAFLIINVAFVTSLNLSGVALQTAAMVIVVFALLSCGVLWFVFQSLEGSQQKQDVIALQLERLLLEESVDLSSFEGRLREIFRELEDEISQLRAGGEEDKANTLRLTQALQGCQANVMVANNDLEIVYMNRSVEQMFHRNKTKLQEILPQLDPSSLIGTCVDVFHKAPQHQRNMVAELNQPYKTRLPLNGLTFDLIATPLFDDDNQRIGTVVEWYDITDELQRQEVEAKVSRDNLRIKNALDVCQANVMMADTEYNIVYVNESLNVMLSSNESTLKDALPRFDVKSLIGTNVDVFHKNPQHQRTMISELTETYETQLKIADLIFNLIATPVFDDQGERIGTVVEWKDMTKTLRRQEVEAKVSRDNLRIKNALDVCQANVMMADTDFNIVYVNESLVEMLSSNETKLRGALPRFEVKSLIGTNVDVFHKNPKHQRTMISNLTDTYQTRLAVAGLKFDLIATPVFASDGERIGTVVEWKDITQQLQKQEEEQRVAEENARIRQALDNVNTNTMIANADNDIIYMNKAINVMLARAEADIKTALPNFDSRNLLGQNIDQFHKNPSHQQRLLSSMSTTYEANISVGGRSFSLIANPIVAESGERIGTVVEWNDRTVEVRMENEIDDLIAAAARGDLSKRIQEEGKDGFFKTLAGGLNRLVSIADGVIEETANMLDAMAHGNLTQRIESSYEGSFDKLKSDANATAEKLTEVISNISGSANTVTSGSEEIAQGNADLSQRTEEQASSLEETASSMEQMTSTVKQNADNSRVASELASDASKRARNGGEVVRKAVESMSEINQSSKKIADIIGVIDEIAFQTNLLALNAAVEAARAGEQGRGFAVVAGEVRNLAQRSAAAAKEIKDLIRDSVTKVEDGTVLVNESGEMLSEIVGAIEKVSQMIQDISIASSEQSEGIEQVNKAISQMDEMTQQNAALVEQASAAGESMAEQARSMKQRLSFFSVQTGQGMQTATASTSYQSSPPQPSTRTVTSSAPAAATNSSAHNFDFGDEDWQEF